MRAMVLTTPADVDSSPLQLRDVADPRPAEGEIRVRVHVCGICRTDLHVIEGELPPQRAEVIPGHQVVGIVDQVGAGCQRWKCGDRVGVAWLRSTCGTCDRCKRGAENLCENARFTGYHENGGYAEYAVVHEDFAYAIPDQIDDASASPLLCAGIIGYRALRRADIRPGCRLGLYGFGASAHIVCQVALHQGRRVFAFTRPGDAETQAFARELGAEWAGDSGQHPPEELDGAIVFAPVGGLVPEALRATAKGATVVCAGIHMSDIPAFPYEILWGERAVRSVANLTRRDGAEFMAIAPQVPVRTEVTEYALADANRALDDLRHGRFRGAAVLVP